MSSLIQNYISGASISTPAAWTATIYTDTSGSVVVKHPNNKVYHVERERTTLQSLSGMVGTFISGQVPRYDGTVWKPADTSGILSLTPTIYSSGIMNVKVILASGFIANGAADSGIVWSGIDQSFDYLEIRGNVRGAATTGGNANFLSVCFNNDLTSGNYISRRFANSEFTFGTSANDFAYIGISHSKTTLNTNCGDVNPVHFFIPNYSVSGQRKYAYSAGTQAYNPGGSQAANDLYGMQWENISGPAINMITLRIDHANILFCSGTNLQLIGHKRQMVIMSGTLNNQLGISHGLLTPQ